MTSTLIFTESLLDTIADSLSREGYLILDELFPESLTRRLVKKLEQNCLEYFKPAGIGRQDDFQLRGTVRADKIRWLEKNADVEGQFLQAMEILRAGLNQRLFLGLFDYESHFAFYPVGAFYKKHLDAFRNKRQSGANRVLSTVFYLNESWPQDAGGELVIYAETNNCQVTDAEPAESEKIVRKILPEFGRMVIFLSEEFPHEVLPATRERKSIAGWFRINEGLR